MMPAPPHQAPTQMGEELKVEMCVICLLAIVVSNMGQVDMSIAMLNNENVLHFEVHV